MKVLFISNLYPPNYLGGYEILCQQVCKDLERRGHNSVILTSTHGVKEATTGETSPNIHRILELFIPFDKHPDGLMRMRRWIVGRHNYALTRALVAKEKPDVIFIWSQLRLGLGSARAAHDSGVPVAYTFNDFHIAGYRPAPLGLKPKAFGKYMADNWIFPGITFKGLNFRHATCISHMLKQRLLERGLPIRDARVIYQGIPVEQFSKKAEPGKIEHPPRLLYVGQLHPYKGVHTLIEAAHLVADRNISDPGSPRPDLRVSIVGDGPEEYKKQLREKAAQGRANIEFAGKVAQPELPGVYREHDIFVFPSTWQEPFGLTHLEAMACGTPVISTADGGHGEFLKDGENALIFEKENPGQLAAQISRLISDNDLAGHLAATARAMVEQEFTLQRYVTDIEAFLQEAATGENR
jgi:glycosyltransferase involved in cell wall biosynthesis